MKKLFIFLLIIMLTTATTAQARTNIGAGWNLDSNVPVVAMNLSYESKKIVFEGVFNPTATRRVNGTNYTGFRLGYNIAGVIPSVGYYYNFYNSDQKKEFNKWRVGYSVKVARIINEDGGIFLNGLYSNSVQLTIGFFINLIKTKPAGGPASL